MLLLPPLLSHNLSENTIGDIQGDFLSNNTTHIYIHNGERSHTRTVEEESQVAGESSHIPTAHQNELRFLRSLSYGSDLVTCEGYRIHVATYLGKVVAVKAYQGPNSIQRLEADLEINSSLFHPTILQAVAVCRAPQTPFLVLSTESDDLRMIPISLGGFKSLVCYLADALSHSETESLIVGAQVIRDVSSGLDYLGNIEQTFPISRLTFDLLVDENNNICITVGLGEQEATGTQEDGYIDIFHKLCIKSFLEANNECYFDNSEVLPTATESRYDPLDLLFSQPEDDPEAETSLESDLFPNEPRREYTFIPDPDHSSLSLTRISADYARFMRRVTKNIRRLRQTVNSTIVAHRCPGYRRDEVTLGTSVSRTAVISHLTPALREICQICHQLVEDGIFNCLCGQGDDGMAPTIQCFRCSVWSHRACQMDGGGQRFLCTSCLSLVSQSQPESPQLDDINSAPSNEDIEISSDTQNHDINHSHGYPVELEPSPDSRELNSSNSEGDSLPAEVFPPIRAQLSARVRPAARVRPTTRVPPASAYFSEALWRHPADKWALLIAASYKNDPRLGELQGPPDEVEKVKSSLTDTLGYKPENIVVLTDRGVDPGNPFYPSKENVLRELKALIKPGEPNIEYFFFFGGHGDQQDAEDGDESEEDDKNGVMLLPGGGRILDNELQTILVEPLKKTPDCRFLALVDASHSCTIMDLPHFRCNRVYPSVIGIVRRLGRQVKEGSSRLVKTKSDPTVPDISVIETIARTATATVMTEIAISSSHMPTVERCTGFCLRGPEHGSRVICISACKDWQHAFERQGLPSMTQAFINAIKRRPNLSLKELMLSIRHDVKFDQEAQISSLNPLHMEAPLFLGLETVS